MALILNLLYLTPEEEQAFSHAAPESRQVFLPGDVTAPLRYPDATVILGNPNPETLADCNKLKWLHTWSAGMDKYQKPGILPMGALLTSSSGAYGQSVSEHLFAMLLALEKRLPAYRDGQKSGTWQDLGEAKTLEDATVLICGTGDLGSCFALLCKALGAKTVGLRRDPQKPANGIDLMAGLDKLDEFLPVADVVALFLPGTPETAGLMDEGRLGRMKSDAILLNGGRGTAVDCDALCRVLGAGHLFGAGLDVTNPEPLPPEHPLWREERCLITPHVAGGNHLPATNGKIAAIALDKLKKFQKEEPLG